ncbi:PAS domain-containing sensor histidine kinase [Halobacterium yunchengense]|uniref:PAS domain-containing sensor histidine kinase n=1 Tax=Halobacterium yunchengense TaxID=3108497 RepID=UPI00300947F1
MTDQLSTEHRYEAICEASPDVIVLVDDDGRITYVNSRVRDVLGYEPGDLLGERVEVLVPERDRETHVRQRTAFLEDPVRRPMGADVDLEARCADGSTKPVDVSLSPLPDSDAAVMAAVRDVSARETLRTKYRTILEAVPDAVVIADAESGEIVESNAQAAAFLGYEDGELVGEPQTVVHPSGEEARYRELFERHVDRHQEIFTQFPDGSPLYVETKAGERIPVDINARVFELDGRTLIAGVFRDVSARTRRAHQLRELHEATRGLVDAADRETVADRIVEAANSILGYTSAVARFLEGDRFEPVAATEQARAEMGPRPVYPADGGNPVSRAHDAGTPLQFEDVRRFDDAYDRGDARSAMYLPVGEYGVLSVVDTDVDAFDRSDLELASILASNAESALDRLASEWALERRNERLDAFAGFVTHDLRNPLNVAQGWLDCLDEAGRTEAAERVRESLDRMDDIVDDTLAFARHGQTVTEPTPLDVPAVARDCWGVVSTADARLEVTEPFRIRGDRRRVRRVFENLFRNAVEHAGEDVTVTVGPLSDGFFVADDGPGIPESDRDAVFEPGQTSTTGGTGLGLPIVDEIADAHGWTVAVTAASRGGARFQFSGVDVLRSE